MYRENKSGLFNIPFGRMNNHIICDNLTLTNISLVLQNVNISYCEYQHILNIVEKDDFVYLDPPYDETFTDYTSNSFGKNEQIQLKQFIDNLNEKGVKFYYPIVQLILSMNYY